MDNSRVQNASRYVFPPDKCLPLNFTCERLFYEMNRDDDAFVIDNLRQILHDFKIKEETEGNYAFTKEENDVFINLYKMIAHTRDINRGKGEYKLAYVQIAVWNDYYPELAKNALKEFVMGNKYGCWKDIKFFCKYYMDSYLMGNKNYNKSDLLPDIIVYCIDLVVSQILSDYENYNTFDGNVNSISNVCKWVPREKSKSYGWLFKHIAKKFRERNGGSDYLYGKNAFNRKFMNAKMIRCKECAGLRKIVAEINKYLDTTQIKQCSNRWSLIEHSRTTKATRKLQDNAFKNVDKNNNTTSPYNTERVLCANNYINHEEHIKNAKDNDICIRENTSANELVNMLVSSNLNCTFSRRRNSMQYGNIINHHWNKKHEVMQIHEDIEHIIPIIDTISFIHSNHHAESPCVYALSTGSRIIENIKSRFGKGYYTYQENSKWVDMSDDFNVSSKISKMIDNTPLLHEKHELNIIDLYEQILDRILANKMTPKQVRKLKIMIIGQNTLYDYSTGKPTFDFVNHKNMEARYREICLKYHKLGIGLFNEPFFIPKLVFWNTFTDNDFPEVINVDSDIGYLPPTFINGMGNTKAIRENVTDTLFNDGMDAFLNFNAETHYLMSINDKRYEDMNPFMV